MYCSVHTRVHTHTCTHTHICAHTHSRSHTTFHCHFCGLPNTALRLQYLVHYDQTDKRHTHIDLRPLALVREKKRQAVDAMVGKYMLRYGERERQTSSGPVERGKSEDMNMVRNGLRGAICLPCRTLVTSGLELLSRAMSGSLTLLATVVCVDGCGFCYH